ncbi:ent-copalyl diphosphate synthase, chloroplastic-like [Cynara cardunculus var. scolymus]|uniref:ent-copalyl diphosphate synthase, chloroplastic-like n=1 Tax=Cynara cardunculus var. scolymus TaxID=59895 RepID=UPI000D6273F2|nr:ent-copalyl diphosphate synthase, chloroplastic-like [Cynara cardunculus var. scolymus]
MLHSMDDGETTMSAYDTAWVALVQDVNGSGRPQFPSCLEWIVNNQLPDGSWGEGLIFLAHDRIINTLACVIALTFWNVHPSKCQKGVQFLKENISKLEDDNEEHMLIGFEVTFPSLIDIARKLNVEVGEDSPVLEEIYARRNMKLTKIPKSIMHKVPTTLLHSLEGVPNLEWEKLVKLQCKDGSFLFSPSSTAFALMQTKDEKCLQYLTNIVTKFNGGVPTAYPLDLFEHIWVVDRLQRLGISRYFKSEIEDCVQYIYRYWTTDGICWARNSNVQDIDDTAMAFRLLRMHGYEISPDVFQQFEKDGKFVCFVGQTTQATTGMFNLLRASQVLFPREKILDDAKKFSYNYLKEKQSTNELLDKWIIAKDLPGEVGYALDVPWYVSLPRLETRCYLDQYGGEDDVWIGKTLYRMGNVSNNKYLEMAKLDYNNCLAMHQLEWNTMQQWYVDFNIGRFRVSNITSLLVSYYLAAASVFEPERSKERIAWAKTTTLVDAISSLFDSLQLSKEQRRDFVDEFRNTPSSLRPARCGKPWHWLMVALQGTLHELASGILTAHGRDIHPQLHHTWVIWLTRWQRGDAMEGHALLIVQTVSLIDGRWTSKELLAHPQYQRLSSVTNNLCHEISQSHKSNENRKTCFENETTYRTQEFRMQELVQLVLGNSPDDLDRDLKQLFLTVAKTFFYKSYYDPVTINAHISKVLFETVI